MYTYYTYIVSHHITIQRGHDMNITLSADKNLIDKGREYAQIHNTTLNNLIRNFLGNLTGEHNSAQAADEFVRLAQSMPGKSESNFKFSRDSIHDRNE